MSKGCYFGDKRLSANGQLLYTRMLERQTVCLRQLGGDRATEVKLGRWLRNERVEIKELIEQSTRKVEGLSTGRHVLAIQDTTEINHQGHRDRTQGLGVVGNGTDKGFFLHPMLTLDAQSHICLGLSAIHVWLRERQEDRAYWQLPIEEKESYRWIQTAEMAKTTLREASQVTIIADRESDIYEEWARIPDERTHLLTRVCRDRSIEEAKCLYAYTDGWAVQGRYRIDVPAQKGKRSGHEAELEIRFGKVTIKRPSKIAASRVPARIGLNVVDVREIPETVVNKEAPIHWRLFTTHAIDTLAQARQLIEWYCQRWTIEQVFRTLKKQGLQVESSQVEHAEGLIKLTIIALQVAVRTLQLVSVRHGTTELHTTDVFSEDEMTVLKAVEKKLQGKTSKQKNPYPFEYLSWAAWVIARLGGWKGYSSESPPGPITMGRGLHRFESIYEGWKLANLCA